MKQLLKILAFVCLCVPLWGQGYHYDSNVFTSANNVPPGSQSTMFTVPFAKITVCAYPDNGSQPCTNTVPIYQDPALAVTAQNPITADVHGRFSFWKQAGFYTLSYVSAGGDFLGTYVISLGGAGGETTLALTTNGTSGPSTLTGNPADGYLLNVPIYGGNITPQVVPPISGQYVVLYPTTHLLINDELGSSSIDNTSGNFGWACSGIFCTLAPLTTATWGGFSLPSYVNPANVTAIYADVITSGQELLGRMPFSGANTTGLVCGGAGQPQLLPSAAPTTQWVAVEKSGLLSNPATSIGSISCNITLGASSGGDSGEEINVAAVRLFVYYTGTAPPVDSRIQIVPPLLYNAALNDLSLDPLATGYLAPFTVLTLPSAAVWSGRLVQVTDGTSSSDCTTGGGSTVNLCRSNGTAWTAYSSGGGGGGLSGQTIGYLPKATSATASTTSSAIDDGVTTAATVTVHEKLSVASLSDPSQLTMPYNAGHAPTGLAGAAVFAPDTSGNATFNENNTGFSRVCTAANGVCGTGTLTGSGTTNTVPLWTGSSAIGNSHLTESGGTDIFSQPVAIGTSGTAAGWSGFGAGTAPAYANNPVTGSAQVMLAGPSSTTGYVLHVPGTLPTTNQVQQCTAVSTDVTCSWVDRTLPFSSITGATNTTAAMLVGSGASLAPTGTGTIQASNIASTITAGTNVTITGSGTTASPYSISSSATASTAFSALTGSTNTTAAMVVGSGASIAPSGTGTIQATNISGTVSAGSGIGVTGSGTTGSPYSVALTTPTIRGAEITSAAATSVAASTDTTPTLATTVNDDGGFVSGTHTNALTVPAGGDGWYIITATTRWANTTTSGSRFMWLKKNGSFTTGPIGSILLGTNGAGDISQQATYVTKLAAGDFISIDLFQNSGSSINASTSTLSMAFLH